MHSAPSVSFPVGRSRFASRLVAGVWLLGAAAFVAWCLEYSGAGWRTAALVVLLLVAGLGVRRATRAGEGSLLKWDGQLWSCSGKLCFGNATMTPQLDFQSLMLVRLQEQGRRTAWLWLDRAFDPTRWLDLRRAVHASAAVRRAASSSSIPQP